MQIGVQNYKSSKFIAPFYGKRIHNNNVVSSFDRTTISTVYLSKFVDEYFSDVDGICQKYTLKESEYSHYGFPEKNNRVFIESQMQMAEGMSFFYINNVCLYLFNTGIGFIEVEISYPDIELEDIVNCSYWISNSFTNEHDGGIKSNLLDYYVMNNGSRINYSLKNAFINICNSVGDDLELFPNSQRMRLNVYHNLICTFDESTDKYIELLKRSLHSNGKIYPDDSNNYSSIQNQRWGISCNCIVSVIDNNSENIEFLKEVFWQNVYLEYYTIFLLVLHEREILLKHNLIAVKNRKSSGMLIKMKKSLIELEILFSYNTMSTEYSYQEFYEKLSEVNKLENLEKDIRDVIDNVEEYVSFHKEKKTNAILTSIALLAIVSVVCDGLSTADRIVSGDPFGLIHFAVLGVILIFVIVGLFFFIRKE